MVDLFKAFQDLDKQTTPKTKDNIVRAPFPYPGSKQRSLSVILEHLPYTEVYVEPFGGSGAVLLARHSSTLEVFNDRYAGVVAFYRCLRDADKLTRLCDQLKLMLHSREEFVHAKETWCADSDDVCRAAKWYYMLNYSFGSLGRNFGRAVRPKGMLAGKIQKKIPLFSGIHDRLKFVQIENQDWRDCITDYDQQDAVIYCDPPYVDTYKGTYKHEMSRDDHREFLDTVMSCKGFVAVSGYSNSLYESMPWNDRYSWDVYVSMSPCAYTESNHKISLKDQDKRTNAQEVLWIKDRG